VENFQPTYLVKTLSEAAPYVFVKALQCIVPKSTAGLQQLCDKAI
jgi:hypothetical protein